MNHAWASDLQGTVSMLRLHFEVEVRGQGQGVRCERQGSGKELRNTLCM